MLIRRLYIAFIVPFLFLSSIDANTFGFKPDGSNYYKTVSEATDGTIQILVEDDDGVAGFSLNFQLHVDYTTNVSTTNWSNGSSGNGYYRDWNPSGVSWTSDNTATHPVTGGYLNASLITSGAAPYWQISLFATSAGDMTYTLTLPIFDDKIYEGGTTGTDEQINFKISNVLAGTLDSDADEFSYRINDNDLVPYYGFAQTSAQSFDEGHNTNDDGDGLSFALIPLANPADGVVYAVGTNSFVIDWTITDGTTTSGDYSAASGTVTINEYKGGGDDNENAINTSRLWWERDISLTMTDDDVDEPDTESFTITISTSDVNDGQIFGDNNELSVVINDDPDDLAPYVRFTSASQYVDEESSNSTVTVSLELNAGSGFSNPAVAYTVSLASTADPDGDYQDHNLANGTVTFDGAVGDQAQDITFTLFADSYDEGLDNNNSVVETIIITLDGDNVTNLRVDNDAYSSTTHTVNIRDNDPTPQLAFSSDASVSAIAGAESVTSPTIKVIISDGSGNLTPSALPITLSVANHTSSPGTATIYSSATAPWDYKINGTTGSVTDVTIPAYTSEYAVPIEINSDSYYEGSTDETVKFDVTAGNNASGGTFTHTYTINEDDAKPSIYFTNGSAIITSTETGSSDITGSVDVQLSAVSARAVDFTYSITSYNAGSGDAAYLSNSNDDDGDGSTDEANEGDAAGTDFSIPASSATIAAVSNINETTSSATINFTHHVDNTDELDKYVELTVALAVGETDATVASDGTQTQIIKLQDDDDPMQLSFSSSSDENNAEGATETITVYKLTDSTTPAQSNGTTATEFTMKATIGVGSSANEATDGATDDDFDLSTSGGTAISPGASQVLTFGTGDASASISIAIDDDELYEGGASGTPEDIKFELSSLVNASAGGNPNMTYYIVDDEDKPVISFDTDASNSLASGDENSVSNPTITVKQDRRSIFASTINYSADPSDGTASADDFTLADGTAEIAALSTSTTIPLEIVSETKFEADETVIISLDASSVSSNTTASGSNMSHTYQINNDDTKPTLNFSAVNISGGSASASSPSEEDGSAIITVSLSAISGVASSVTYTIASGSGASDADWTDATADYDSDASTNIITWAADETTVDKTIVVNFTDDNIDEADETITVTLSGVSGGAQSGSTLVHTITLRDSDSPPVMQFTNSTMSVNENAANITIPLTLTHDGTNKQASDVGNAQLTWTINGLSTATAHSSSTDYPYDITTATSGTVVINKGLTDGSIIIPLNDDAIDEWDETLIIDLSSPVNATASGNQSITVTINDGDDTAPTINFTTTALGSGTTETASSNATINFTDYISLTGKSGKDLWFSYTTEGGGAGTADANQDYTPITGTFKIAEDALTPSTTIPLNILSDDIDELDEQTVIITIDVLGADQNDDNSSYEATSNAESAIEGSMTFTYTIDDDDDLPNAFFKNVDGVDASESGSISEDGTSKNIVVALSSGSERDITLYYSDAGTGDATSGSDYTAITAYSTLTLSGAVGGTGDTEATITIPVTDDEVHEDDQTVIINLLTTGAVTSDMSTVSFANAGGGSGIEAVKSYTLTILNDEDPPKVNFTDGSASTSNATTVAEDAGSVVINVELNRATEKTVTIPFTFSNDATIPATGSTATGAYPVDFYHASYGSTGSLTINGDGSDVSQGATISINLLADAVDEWNEKIILNIGSPTNAEVGTVTTHTVTVNDQSDAPTVNFTTTAQGSGTTETASAAATINFTDHISLTTQSGKDLWFSYSTDDNPGTATSGQDYTPVSGSFKIAAGSTTPATTIALPILSDDVDELDEQTVKVTIDVLGADQDNDNSSYEATSNTETAVEGSMVYTYTIDDDDDPPYAFFKNLDGVTDSEVGSIDEGETKTITVALSSASERDIVIYRSDAGTGDATSGSDYTAITAFTKLTTISGTAGGIGAATEVTFDVATTEDLIDEEDQTIVISLSTTPSVTGDMDVISYATAGGGTDAQAVKTYTLTITDDEELPKVKFTDGSTVETLASSISEDAGLINVNVELSIATEKTVTVPFTFGSSSTPAATGSNSTGAYPIDFYHSGYTGGGTLTINGDGTDVSPGTVIALNILADAIDEWDEKIVLDFGTPVNAETGTNTQHIVTITDVSDAPTVNFTTTAQGSGTTETASAAATINFTDHISLTTQSGKDLWFSYSTDDNPGTATSGQDYTPVSGSFKIAAGSTTPATTIALPILSDDVDELDEQTVKVTIDVLGADQDNDNSSYEATSNTETAVEGSMVYTYTIDDDDDPPYAFFKNLDGVTDSEVGSIDEGETKTITVALSSASERDIVIYRSDAGTGDATSGSDYTAITAFTKLTTISGTAGGIGAATEVTFDVATTEDLIDEEDQTIVISLSTTPSVTGDMDVISYATAGGGTDAQAVKTYTLTITDDEELPSANFTDGSASTLGTSTIAENAGTVTINVELSIATEKTVTVPFTFGSSSTPAATGSNSTGAYPIDFYHSGYTGGGTLTINGDGTDVSPGASFTLNIQADAIDEWDEKIDIILGDSPTNAQKGGTFQHVVTITDVSNAPTINFSSSSLNSGNPETTQASNDYNLKSIIALDSQSGKNITFSITTESDGNGATASAPRDYSIINDTFTITAGNTAPTDNIILDILDDLYDEEDTQTIVVDIAFLGSDKDGDGDYDDPDGDPAAVNGATRFTYTINDDENSPTLVFASSTYTLDEDAGNATSVKVKFDPSGTTLSERTVTGLLSVKNTSTASNGTDFTTISDETSLVITDGINGTIFPGITITDDDRWEAEETIVLELTVDASGSGNAIIDVSNDETIITIADDPADEPTIEFLDADGNTINTASINEADLTYNVRVGISNSKISEKAISIGYSIDFSTSTARFDEDDDGTSSNYPADFRKWGSSSTSIFSTTALDYTAPNTSATGTITINAGDASTASSQKTYFTIPLNVDGVDENTEYLDINLGTVTNAAKGDKVSLRISIEDHVDDAPVKYSFATSSAGTAPASTGTESESPTFMVVLLDPSDQTQLKESGKPITLNWTIALDGTNGDATKDLTEAIDFLQPDFDGNNSFTKTITISPRTGSNTTAPTSYTIGTSDIDFNEADVTYESTEYFKLSLASADANAAVGSSDGATDEHYFALTNIDNKPIIILSDSDAGVTLYEQSSQGPKSHDFQFEVSSSGIQKSELPIHAYFTVSNTASGADNDADISFTGTYEAGDLDYTYSDGPLLSNQIVTIDAPITASSTGSITLSAYDDALYEQDETLVLGMYTYDAAQAAAASFNGAVGLTSQSYATAPDGAKVDDTGYDEVLVTIKKDETDKPSVNFVDASGNAISTVSFREDTSGAKYTVRIKSSSTSSEPMTIPYSLTLDYDGDEKTARVGAEDDPYPYDFWIASSSEPNFSITGDKSSSTVAADGFVVIPASNALESNTLVSFDITINNDKIYEFDEKIILTLGTTDNATLTNASLGSNIELTLTIKNDGESAPVLTMNRALKPDESGIITSSTATISGFTEEASGSNEDNNDPHFEVKIVDPTTGDVTEAGMDLKYSYTTSTTDDATAGSDFTATTAIGTISRGSGTSSFSIPILDDTIDEEDQIVKVLIAKVGYDGNGDDTANDVNAGDDANALVDDIAANRLHTFTIIDNDDPPIVSFFVENGSNIVSNVETQTVTEKTTGVAGTHTVTVKASSVSEKLITVKYAQLTSDSDCASAGNCADSGSDFVALADLDATPFTIAAGQTANTFTITTIDDDRDEWDQDIVLELSIAGLTTPNATISSAEANGPPKYRLIIQDSDDEPFLNFASDASTFETAKSVTEGSDFITKVYLSRISEKDITIGYTIEAASSDFGIYTASPSDGSGGVTYPEDHAGLSDGSEFLTNNAAGDTDVADEFLHEVLTIATSDDNIDEWDEKFKIIINATDHSSNPTVNAKIGSDAPVIIATISDNDALEAVAFTTVSATDDENDVTNVEGSDPGPNTINIPIAIAKQSGKDMVLKYSIDNVINYPSASDFYYDPTYARNENIATRGHDYNFGTVTTNVSGDSIVTIAAGNTTAYIPLTILDDDFDEYDQILRVKLSLANSSTWTNDPTDPTYDSFSGAAGAEASVGANDIYTFTIKDNDQEPYIQFEADAATNETNSGSNVELISVNLIDGSGNSVISEKTISMNFALDTDRGEGEVDYTSASLDIDNNGDKYLDDFKLTDDQLVFTGYTYTYSTATSAFTKVDGESSKDISLTIYGDDLYEVDEYVNIELSTFENSQTSELVSGDFSYVHTITNDDGMPAITWVGANSIIQEGDPTTEDGTGDYQNTDILLTLSKETGTDILVQYSEKTGGTAESGSDDNYDFYLGTDNTDLSAIGINTKSVTIPAFTSTSSSLTLPVPVNVWDDDIVEKTLLADNENFFLQIDAYRDKGADGSWATVDDNKIDVVSDNEFEVTIFDNDLPPADFTVGDIITKTTNADPVIVTHWNPVTAGYWNAYNSGLSVTVPIENNSNLIGGSVRLIAKVDGFAYNNLTTPVQTITQAELDAGTFTFDVSNEEFEGTVASPTNWFAEGNEVLISAVITDNDGNETYGTESATKIIIDETAPVVANYVISSALPTGGTVVELYWNSTNTGLDVSVTVQAVDASVSNGSVRVLAGIGTDANSAAYEQLGDPVSVIPSNNITGGVITSSITKAQVLAQTEYDEEKTINLKAEVVDIAGNKAVINIASTKLFIDTTLPTISRVESIDPVDGSAKNGIFGIDSVINLKFTFSENLTLTEGVALVGFNNTIISVPEIASADLQNASTVTIPYTVQSNDVSPLLAFTGLTLPTGNKLRDTAGNDMGVLTADVGFSLEDLSVVEVDGLAPSAFTVDTVIVQGSNVVSGYWNSNSTSIIVPINNPPDDFGTNNGDPSLIGGKVQILGRVYNTSTNTPSAFVELGTAKILVEGEADGGGTEPSGSWNVNTPLHYGQFPGKTLHFEIDAVTMETALSALENYPDESVASPEQNGKIDFAAIITDRAGNPTQGSATEGSVLIVDEVMPLDPAIGLPSSGYNYTIAPPIDNYVEIIPDTTVGQGFSRQGFFNSTNTGVTFRSWISFNDNNPATAIDRDQSLIGGTVQVQMASSGDASTATWTNIGNAVVIQEANVATGFVNVSIDSSIIRSVTGDFVEGNTLFFRNVVTDKAGNVTEQSVVSSKTLLIDTTPHVYADLTYSRQYVNGVDHNPVITISFDPTDFPYSPPKLTATYKAVSPNDPTDDLMTIGVDSSKYTYTLDIPGVRGIDTYDDTVSISISATDKAGNPILAESVSQKRYLIVDNTPPKVLFAYKNTTNDLATYENKGKQGDIIRVVAFPDEPMFLSPDSDNEVSKPTLSVDSLSAVITTNLVTNIDGNYDNTSAEGDSIEYLFTIPTNASFEEKEFLLKLFINGTDWAGNPVDSTTGYQAFPSGQLSNMAFKLDSKAPYFDQFLLADSSYIKNTTLRWYNNEEKMSTAFIKFEPVDAPATPAVPTEGNFIALTDESASGGVNELFRGLLGPYEINNNTLLVDALADSNTYNIIFQGTDMVGNVGSDTIKYVTYDTKAPTAKIEYETEYITSLSPKTGTTIKVTFNELQTVAPKMRLFYGGLVSQSSDTSEWGADMDSLSTINTSVTNPITLIDSTDDARVWYHVIDSSSVPANSEGFTWDGFVWAKLSSNDLAGNAFDSLAYSDFENTLLLDNTEPTATITYTNLRDSLLTIYDSSNPNESNCCYAIAGDTVLVKVEMNEKIKNIPASPPTLNLEYNFSSEVEGSSELNIEPIPHPDDVKFIEEQTGLVFHYKIVVKDSAKNDGVLKVALNANDRTGTPVTKYGNSLQSDDVIESRYALNIDNIHPWGYEEFPIFSESQSEVTFPTEQFSTTGFRVIENWINKKTDSLYIGVPYQAFTSDQSLLGESSGWGPQGKIDFQVRNLDLGTGEWQTLGTADTLKSNSPQIVPVGDYAYLRTISRPVSDLIPGTMLNVGNAAFNRLQFRAVLTDKNGNSTSGQPSDAYKLNAEDLYIADILNADTVRYDIASPSLGNYNDGNFNAAVGSQIISSDTITISWTEFTDPGGGAASGVDLYEMQVYVYPSTWTGGTEADTLGRLDSLFTVDMDLDGVDDSGYWYKIYKEQAPSFDNPITLNLLDSAVTDSISNTEIIYDYNDTLKHELHYMIFVRAFDEAGNASDTIYTNAIQRYNSAPVFIENIADLNLFEDVAWDYDTVKVSDLDLTTLQNDSFTYFIEPKKLIPNIAGGFDTSNVLINPPIVDPITGFISWTPIQDSTLTLTGQDTIIDQSGQYVFTFYAEDAFGFRDTINYNATVNAVNDTPVVAILGDDKVLTWREDKPASEVVKINLSEYVQDIDNLDSEISWQFVIMDTSQLDEDFPLASVIVGPGTPKAVQTKLMKQYMGFDPSKGIDIPTLARRSGNTMQMLSMENSLISIDIDTTTDENTYAVFSSDSNYYGSNHRVIFSAIDPFGALDKDTIIVNILPENDPPVVAAIDTIVINENDSIWIDFSQFTSDVDDTTLTFTIEGVFNTDSINFFSEPYLSDGVGDTVLFDPFDLWSGVANFRVTASDEEAESSQLFTLNVLRVPRPDIEVSLIQNNAFSSYVSIIIVDKEQKTKFLQLEVQNQRIDIDTVAAFTYTGDFSFGIGGGYSFDVLAVAEVGRTIYTNTFNLAPARVSNRWYANSSDGRFSVAGDPGSVDSDQNFLIVDSSLFISNFSDQASYVLGDETYIFNKPIEIHFGSVREDLSIYQRENGVIWKELPSINRNGQILTYTENAGYFRLGPKTIIVPEETDLHQNYPNPFNPSTTVKYDIGLMDGLEQRVSVNVYNVVGQHVTTLVNNVSQVGQFYVKWDGADKFGKTLPSGIYFVQLKTDSGIIKNKKMMFLK